MNWLGNLRLSALALKRAGAGTLLSACSMAVGVTSVVILFGISSGAKISFENSLKQLGDNLIVVGAERIEANALRGAGLRFRTLTLEDSMAIKENIDSVVRVAPIAMNNYDLNYNGESLNITTIGTTAEFQYTNNQILSSGRFIDDLDLADQRRVAVIGADVAKNLFHYEQPLGERLLVGGAPYIVIGVLQTKGTDATGSPQDDRILIPITTAMHRLIYTENVDRIFVQGRNKEGLNETINDVTTLLRHRHGISEPSDPSDFTVRDQATIRTTLADTEVWLKRILIGVSGLALTMSSIGLFSVSLLSIKERHSEIGLRLAVGGLPVHILIQFLSEAIMTSLLGALAGLTIGITCILIGDILLGWQLSLTANGIFIPFAISLSLSLISGSYPALHAARFDPIIALRSA